MFSIAKNRDASQIKLDSEVVPKVARMTVSGKKQTMGFDVPRYMAHFQDSLLSCSHLKASIHSEFIHVLCFVHSSRVSLQHRGKWGRHSSSP